MIKIFILYKIVLGDVEFIGGYRSLELAEKAKTNLDADYIIKDILILM
jgi:hypothetical protein